MDNFEGEENIHLYPTRAEVGTRVLDSCSCTMEVIKSEFKELEAATPPLDAFKEDVVLPG